MRKHNGGNWADFRPLSNVMVRPSFMRLEYSMTSRTIVVVALLTHQVAQVQRLTPTKEGQYLNWPGLH